MLRPLILVLGLTLSASCGGKTTTPAPTETPTATPPSTTAEAVATEEIKSPAELRCEAGIAVDCFRLSAAIAEEHKAEILQPTDESGAKVDDFYNRSRALLVRACELKHPCACAALDGGSCSEPDECSEPDGQTCAVTCAQEPSCADHLWGPIALE